MLYGVIMPRDIVEKHKINYIWLYYITQAIQTTIAWLCGAMIDCIANISVMT